LGDLKIKLESKGISLSEIFEEQEKELHKAIKGLAVSTYDDIIQMAQKRLTTSRQDYIKSMDFQDMGSLWIISIENPGLHFEEGFSGFDQKEGLLSGPKA